MKDYVEPLCAGWTLEYFWQRKSLPTIAVLMSTYNGEKYIREQLDSIFSQKGIDVKLFVRDDGSSDSTVDILKEYAHNNPVIMLKDNGNVEPGESFMRLLYAYAHEPGIDFYAFADQDDIWLEDKLLVAVRKISECDNDEPILYSSNQYLYINGENKGLRFTQRPDITLISEIKKNLISGCTFVFNRALAHLVAESPKPDAKIIKFRLHDTWIMLVAIVCGRVIYDEASHILYRIHNDNVVGISPISFRDRINRLEALMTGERTNLRMLPAAELLRLFPIKNEQDVRILKLYANYKSDIKSRINLIFDKEIRVNCGESPFVFIMKVVFGWI